ncbi:hypothetical protein ACNAN0_08605 [Agrilactobacillus fermenti]|uniref:hypothetical protein n=1 Tax=Agrilactobacillus fermenti TaxID=2586909 RepID=UPI001E42EDDB|nr:hypothetical protein [Agrilactobacillus fermenti]MCD2257235.1 hypothetical protein [Agrilactobacillus fermenti]
MTQSYQDLNLIEEITRLDGSKYYEVANIFMNGRAELAAIRGFIKQVKILQLNIPKSTAVKVYEQYVNDTYTFPAEDFDHWEEWQKPAGKIETAFQQILKENHIG